MGREEKGKKRRSRKLKPKAERNRRAVDAQYVARYYAARVPERHREDFIQQFLLEVLLAPKDKKGDYTLRRATTRAFHWLRRQLRADSWGLDDRTEIDQETADPMVVSSSGFAPHLFGLDVMRRLQERQIAFYRERGRLVTRGVGFHESAEMFNAPLPADLAEIADRANPSGEPRARDCDSNLEEAS